jgi:hypothetical protein
MPDKLISVYRSSRRYKTVALRFMKTKIEKIEALQRAIEIILSKNRHVFLAEDIKLLEKCLEKLEKLKKDMINEGIDKEKFLSRLTKIIKLLDVFFGLSGNIQDFFDDFN